MIKGIVTSLEIIDLNFQLMDYRGSKSDSHISVKEQRVDGFSIFLYCKVYSKCQGNLVFIHSKINGLISFSLHKKYFNFIYSYTQKFLYSNYTFQRIKFLEKESNEITFSKLNPYYITGFTDGEGCFYVGVSPNQKSKTGFRVKIIFQIGVHIKDFALLKQIKFFFGVGNISNLGQESIQYRVSALEDLKVIINHFDEFSLLTYKQFDFLLFKEVIELMEQRKHLTLEGLNRIVSIKASLNTKKISDKLKLAFPNLLPILNSQIRNKKIKSLYWLTGFTDAEGCFFIALKKSKQSKLGETVWLTFIVSQHIRDKDFLESLIYTLKCGRYISKSNNYGEFRVEKFSDIYEKIIPIFDNLKLQGWKSKDFEDFKKAALLIKNKTHLTRKGLDEIKKIKGGMNKNRKYLLRHGHV